MNRIEKFHSIYKSKKPPLCIKFMVSIGANPIISMEDEKQFPIGNKRLSIKRGEIIFKKQNNYALTLARTDEHGQLPSEPF